MTVDDAILETADQLTDWVDLGEDLPRARLVFVPSGRWASIIARQNACTKGKAAVTARIETGDSKDIEGDCTLLGSYETQLLQVAGEVVGLSLRQLEGDEPLQTEGSALLADELEPLVLSGTFWPVYNAVMRCHWLEPDTARALFRRRLGESV